MSVILALDASGKKASVCILKNDEVIFEKELCEGFTHSQTLLQLANEALVSAKLDIANVGAFAVSAGPGSFTGLRIGMALAKGLAFTRDAPLVNVSTLEATALASGVCGRIVCALDARRGEVYWAAFENVQGKLVRKHVDEASPAAEIAQIMGEWLKLAQFVGDGAEVCYNSYDYIVEVQGKAAKDAHSTAFGVAMLARAELDSGNVHSHMDARCNYIRLSQAQRLRAQQEEKPCVNQ